VIPNFSDTIELKERFNYNTQLAAGQNFVGTAMSSPGSVTKTLAIQNLDSSAVDPARLQVSIQGFSFVSHQVNVFVNNLLVGTMKFFGRERLAQTFNVPVSKLVEGNNAIMFIPTGTSDVSFFDYARLSYPHSYSAASNSLRFTVRSRQSVKVDGFSTSNIRLIDVTDPVAIKVTRPLVSA